MVDSGVSHGVSFQCWERKEVCDFTQWLSFTDKTGGIDSVLEEIAELRHAVSAQNEYISSMADPFKRQGCWYFMPPPPSSKVGILCCWKSILSFLSFPNLLAGAVNTSLLRHMVRFFSVVCYFRCKNRVIPQKIVLAFYGQGH